MNIYWYRLYDERPQATFIAGTLEKTPWAFNIAQIQSTNVRKTKKNRYLIVCKMEG